MWCTLHSDTVALRVTSAPTTKAKVPFGRCGLWFTREPQVLLVEDIGEELARTLCEEHQLTTEQLTDTPSLPSAEAEPSDLPPPAPPPPPYRARQRTTKPKSKRRTKRTKG